MIGEGLDDPLGQRKAPARSNRLLRHGALAAVSALALAGLGFLAFRGDGGHGGEPFAVAAIDRPPPAVAANSPAAGQGVAATAAITAPADQTGAIAGDMPGQDVRSENGVEVVRATRIAGSKSVVLKVPQAQASGLAAAPDPRLSEPSAFGLLPKVGSDGSRPADVYARPYGPVRNKPRVAIVVGGMGLDPAETARAVASLPPTVTLGFAPYGPDLDTQVRQARDAGHEVLLQLPMEDFGRTDSNLSHVLTANPHGNADRLHWLMGRFTGYAGVANYLGGRLLGDETALAPLLREIAARGLYFVDDGTAARSLATSVASDVGLPSVRADVVIDAKPDSTSTFAALSQLEALARQHGYAVGVATGLPGTNEIIRRYTAGLSEGGITLVPISQIVKTEARASARDASTKPAEVQ